MKYVSGRTFCVHNMAADERRCICRCKDNAKEAEQRYSQWTIRTERPSEQLVLTFGTDSVLRSPGTRWSALKFQDSDIASCVQGVISGYVSSTQGSTHENSTSTLSSPCVPERNMRCIMMFANRLKLQSLWPSLHLRIAEALIHQIYFRY